jgi:cardiolipin synthase
VSSSAPLGPVATGFVQVGSNRVRFLRDGTEAFPHMLEAIAAAREEVLLEMYWIGADRVGRRFRDALAERARAGLRVRVVFDAIGSLETPTAFWDPLVDAGAEVQEFSPISPFKRPFRLRHIASRDHRKLLVIDGAIGFTGGINIGEAWAPPDAPEAAWRDDAIEVQGPAAAALRTAFYVVWGRASRAAPVAAAAALAVLQDSGVRVLTNRIGDHPNRSIARTYLFALRHATTSIDIANAYFLPGPRFLHALRRAARRGVRIRVLVAERSDVRIVALATQSLYGRLLGDGVEVFAYSSRVLHAKTALFDGRFTLIGSHNLDATSTRFNLECGVVVDSEEFARIVGASFERDLAEAKKVELREWEDRPPWIRLVGRVAGLFGRFL